MTRRFLTPIGVPALSAAPSSTVTGAMYYDTDDGKLYVYNGSTWSLAGAQGVQGIQGQSIQGLQGIQGLSGAGGGGGGYTFSGTAPSSPTAGDRWTDSNTGFTYTYTSDGNTNQWVDLSSGYVGLQGLTGTQGLTGSQGIQGLTGIQGTTGTQGLTGIQGFTGAQGTTGIQGFTGIQGLTGPQGTTGAQGVQGTTGIQGLTGGVNDVAKLSTTFSNNTTNQNTVISYVVPANTFVAGMSYRIKAYGYRTGNNNSAGTIRLNLGGSTLSTYTHANSATSTGIFYEGVVTCQTTGVSGTFIAQHVGIYNAISLLSANSATTTLDTTTNLTLEITQSTANTNNTYNITNATIEELA